MGADGSASRLPSRGTASGRVAGPSEEQENVLGSWGVGIAAGDGGPGGRGGGRRCQRVARRCSWVPRRQGGGPWTACPPPGTSHVGKHFLLKKPTPSCSRSRRRVRVPPRAADGQAPHSAFQRGARGPRRPCGHTRTSTPTLPRPEARALPTYSSASTLKTQRGNQSDFIENYAMCNSRLETTDAPSPPVRARFDLNSPSHSGTMC